jgi:mutator protein MutT
MPPASDRVSFSVNLIENDRGELLMLKRAATLQRAPGKWGFPAGQVEPGETPDDCSRRELREEIGPRHELEPLNCIGPIRDRQFNAPWDFHLYHYRWRNGEIVLNEEHTAYAWVSREAFRGYDTMPGMEEDILYLGIW